MEGFEAEWLPGADHAGIATQVIVEKQLTKEGTTRREIGREKFVERTRAWAYRNKDIILSQLRRIGCSCDWERTRFTLDEGLSRAVGRSLQPPLRQGLDLPRPPHRQLVPVLPDLALRRRSRTRRRSTATSGTSGTRSKGSDEYLTVATTRPETMLGDTALAVSPKDSRVQESTSGKTVILPILEREIPIVADSYVDPEFGTGVVKVTPAHDPNDFEIGKRHDLQEINILNTDGTLNENAGKYKGLDRYDGRKQLVDDLEKKGAARENREIRSLGRHLLSLSQQ